MRWFAALLVACALPGDDLDGDGWTVRDGDCDDLDPTIHPGARDFDVDGVDQDCDGIDPLQRVVGTDHSCILGTEGQILCEGLESADSEHHWVQIASGSRHYCALDDQGLIDCWGSNDAGQLDVPEGERFVSVAAVRDSSFGFPVNGDPPLCWGLCWETVPEDDR